MQRLALGMMLALAAGAVSAQSGAAYQWKDANGVTHYSSTPPPSGTYQTRAVNDHGASIAATAAAAAPAEDPQCATARANLKLLQGKGGVQIDSDGDGKPDRPLTEAERGDQAALAEATLKANCGTAASAKP
ncbi:DUF4124 domain-containing protein [Luteimonas sp. SX5]|uniref:DUF4124 domain-containing protein n=1 Tax=Luteimonas galliterrae TaxID=2940486 RepID=A0ABT0MK50_9GAMM|nr:DUF4124 domain-containing protein [Luteimonas galliterrae]MCL1634609.1 DUF4124 domain-containing protein [Luteimonas galliterrae]